MAVTASYQPYFIGRVIQKDYSEEFDFEHVPNYATVTRDGVEVSRYIASYTRNFVTAKVIEQTFKFEGLTMALAHGTDTITVADLAGNEYTFPLKSSITDGSSGSRVMVTEEIVVDRTPMSPHMWELTVMRRGLRYFVNGEKILDGPGWISTYM